ncbi:MAG: TIGR04282 family arsenosugar biosynthesis glycosyltransferase [Nitrospirae bacterium]|nr:TIGR04282 family arsenosugar biosynthesis glycosyltransferase [Nitrospirota bacterium]MBI3593663.1 TIGR04282 family arsenosugar biosynthesis glycosyltransferase [Nitrospirota bacterium]
MSNRSALIVFAKKPLLGQVKSRFQPVVSPEMSLEIYRNFVEVTLDSVKQLSDTEIWLGCFPDSAHPWFEELSKRFELQLFDQKGENLGIRMEKAFELLSQNKFHKKVIIGTDSPHLPLHFIQSAIQYLDHSPVVLGPSRDGGYYLLGISGEPPSLFDGISWSTESVLSSTLMKLLKQKIPFRFLPEWYDIDRFEDLVSLHAYWKSLKRAGGNIPEIFFRELDRLESIQNYHA